MALFTYLPEAYAWRAFFCIGFLPSLFVLWIRRNVEEATVFVEDRQATRQSAAVSSHTRLWDIFRLPHLSTTFRALRPPSGSARSALPTRAITPQKTARR